MEITVLYTSGDVSVARLLDIRFSITLTFLSMPL